MLPKRDGLSVIGSLRDKGNRTPVLILSALGQVDEPHQGPARRRRRLSAETLFLCRAAGAGRWCCRAAMSAGRGTTYRVGDLELDRLSHRVARGKDELTLQPREFRLLEYLMKQCRPSGDADHAAGECLGLSFRSADQR